MAVADFLGPFNDVPGPDAVAAPAPGPAKRLSFSMAQPKPTEWCWAATTAAVASFYASVHGVGNPLTPCQVATQCLYTECCPEPTDPSDPRNREYAIEGALRKVGHLAQDPIGDSIGFDQIVSEINADRPICCHIAWDPINPNDGHFNAIIGYDATTRDLDISDCLYLDQTLPYDTFKTAYQHKGSWDLTYLTS